MVSVVIPIYNAAGYLPALLSSLRQQTLAHELILIDSGSDEATQAILTGSSVRMIRIANSEFNHGGTRNLGVQEAQYETVIFLTQDALPAAADTLKNIVSMLHSDNAIAMAYGRQLPYSHTGPFGRFARLINYPAQSLLKTKAMIPVLGIRTCSCSNSFAAYKKDDLLAIGGFPETTILGEDVSVAARFILSGKTVAYCAEAAVYHSHDYTVGEEFKRYFDIGVFHQEQQGVLASFKQAEGEGFKYVKDEYSYLKKNHLLSLLPEQFLRTAAKYAGYTLGRHEQRLPRWLKQKMSMHTGHWSLK